MIDQTTSGKVEWDQSLVSKAQDETPQTADQLLEEYCPELNEYHRIRWCPDSYNKLLGNWLLHFIQILYDRWYFASDDPSINTTELLGIPQIWKKSAY